MPSQLCIHCLVAPAEERDHVLPKAWHPDGTDPGLQRLRVPSCRACGARLKKAEEQMALALTSARGFDRNHPAAAGIWDRVRLTWDPAAADSPREFKHRRDRIYSIMTRVQPIIASPPETAGAARIQARTPTGLWVKAVVALRFRWGDFESVIAKFVRGLHYDRIGTPLPMAARITTFDPSSEMMKEAANLPGGSLSDGLLYRFYEEKEAGRSWWFFVLWGQVNLAAMVEMAAHESLVDSFVDRP
jgi:hypothetical protein